MSDARLRVLLVEDDTDYALIARTYLLEPDESGSTFAVEHSEDLETAVKTLKHKTFDVILLDLYLPDSRGIETVLLVLSEARHIPIVVLTSIEDQAMALEAMSLGAQDFLVKGAGTSNLLKRAIRYAVERKKLVTQIEDMILHAADGMVVVDRSGIVHYLNSAAEELFNQKKEELLGKPCPFAPTPDQPQRLTLSCKDGDRAVDVRVTEITWFNEPAYLASLHDVTHLLHVERLKGEIKERRHWERQQTEFLNSIANVLRIPLNMLEESIENLGDETRQESREQFVRRAKQEMAQLTRILERAFNPELLGTRPTLASNAAAEFHQSTDGDGENRGGIA